MHATNQEEWLRCVIMVTHACSKRTNVKFYSRCVAPFFFLFRRSGKRPSCIVRRHGNFRIYVIFLNNYMRILCNPPYKNRFITELKWFTTFALNYVTFVTTQKVLLLLFKNVFRFCSQSFDSFAINRTNPRRFHCVEKVLLFEYQTKHGSAERSRVSQYLHWTFGPRACWLKVLYLSYRAIDSSMGDI